MVLHRKHRLAPEVFHFSSSLRSTIEHILISFWQNNCLLSGRFKDSLHLRVSYRIMSKHPLSLFVALTSQRKYKMALLGEQPVTSVCKIETSKVSPPALLSFHRSYLETRWTSITFYFYISCLHHQQWDKTLGDLFHCLGSGTCPSGFTNSHPVR